MKEYLSIKDFCSVSSSKRIFANQYVEEGIPFYRQKEIIEKTMHQTIEEPIFISQSLFNSIKDKFGAPEKGDILITAVGVTLGIPYVVEDETFYFKDGNLIWLNSFDKNFNSKYVFYWLRTKFGRDALYMRAIGSAQPAITIDMVKKYKLLVPDRNTQDLIVNIISAYDSFIELNNKRIKLLEQMAEEIYKEWFIRFRFPNYNKYKFIDGIPECFKVVKVYDYINFEKGFEPGAIFYLEDNSKLPFNRVGDIESRKSQYYIDKELFKDIKLLKQEDVVISFDASIGKMGYGLEGAYSSGVCKISGKNKKIIGNLLVWSIFHNESMQAQIQSYANGSTIGHAGKCIKKIRMLYNEKLFKLYTEKTECIYQELINLINQNNILTEQRDMLLPRLMSGKLEVK